MGDTPIRLMIRCPKCRAVNEDTATACHVCRSLMVAPAPNPLSSSPVPTPDEVKARMSDPTARFGPPRPDGSPRYVLLERMGEGGKGVVWKAWDLHLQRYVAIKQIREVADVKRFVREARTVAQLSHPNVAQVFDVGEHEGQPYMVMQLVDGKPLGELKDPKGIAGAIREAAMGLAYAHQHQVVHQDVKPDNIVVHRADGRVFVVDFGMAAVGKAQGVGGTPAYMSPEQAAGKSEEIDARTDVYGLGATLYSLLAERPPYQGNSSAEVIQKVSVEEPEPLWRVKPDCPPALARIVEKAMARKREWRYASMAEMAVDLERFLTESAPAPAPAKRSSSRLLWIAGAIGVAAALALFGAYWKWWRKKPAPPVPQASSLDPAAEERFQAAMKRAETCLKSGRAEEAKKAFDEALAMRPDAAAYHGRGAAWKELGVGDGAIADFTEAIRLDGSRVDFFMARADAYAFNDALDAAIQDFTRVTQLEPKHPYAYLYRGIVREKKGDLAGAIADWETCLKNQPDQPDAAQIRANIDEAKKKQAPVDPVKNLKEPRTWEEYRVRAGVYAVRREDEKALADYDCAIQLRPAEAALYYERALVYHRTKNLNAALEDYNEAIHLDPKHEDALSQRALVYSDLGDWTASIKDWEECLKVNPNRPDAAAIRDSIEKAKKKAE